MRWVQGKRPGRPIQRVPFLLPRPFASGLFCGRRVKNNSQYLAHSGVTDVEVKCYGEYGCFSVTGPWQDTNSRPVNVFPERPDKIAPRYCLYTRSNRNTCQYLDHRDPATVVASNLIPSMPTYFVTHGFLEGGDRPWLNEIARQILRRYDANMIVVDWERGSGSPYTQAVANIRMVGRVTAHLINVMRVSKSAGRLKGMGGSSSPFPPTGEHPMKSKLDVYMRTCTFLVFET